MFNKMNTKINTIFKFILWNHKYTYNRYYNPLTNFSFYSFNESQMTRICRTVIRLLYTEKNVYHFTFFFYILYVTQTTLKYKVKIHIVSNIDIMSCHPRGCFINAATI